MGSSGLLSLIKDFVLSIYMGGRRVRLYGEHTNVHQSTLGI